MATPRQAKCGKCKRTVGYGKGIVIEYGGGGRFHKECLPETPVRKTDRSGK